MSMRTIITTSVAGFLAGLAAFAAASPASAEAPTLRLRYQFAELRTDAGAAAVFERIRRGAVRACYDGASIQHHATARRCRKELTDLMVTKLAHPRIAGIHAAAGPVRIAAR
ncbi:UrcA family protein [uncultured Sphingomonas sp.]|uniref:UrcA family protein n=1 Tax=uncultured Sphingomonas sp. TaxID=158754 RepID=UPI0035CBD683